MRNIQKNLILNWSKNIKISEIIKTLPTFCNNFEEQVKQSLFPNIGEYILFTYRYDINDFLMNINNICHQIKIPGTINGLPVFIDKYLVITTTTIIILEPVEKKRKNICVLNFVGNLFTIEKLQKYKGDNKNLEKYYCFKIVWDSNESRVLNTVICIDPNKINVQNVTESILVRRDILKKNFKYYEKCEDLDVETYEKIIDVKKSIIEQKPNEIIFDDINKLYRKIIEKMSFSSEEDVKKYLDEFHEFIGEYEKIKNKKKYK